MNNKKNSFSALDCDNLCWNTVVIIKNVRPVLFESIPRYFKKKQWSLFHLFLLILLPGQL